MHQQCRSEGGELKEPFIPYMTSSEAEHLSFQEQGARSWNGLPTAIRFVPSLSRFKKALRLHLLELDG